MGRNADVAEDLLALGLTISMSSLGLLAVQLDGLCSGGPQRGLRGGLDKLVLEMGSNMATGKPSRSS